MLVRILFFAVPVVLAPFAVLALRRLFAYFLREGTELFTGKKVPRGISHALGSSMATLNVVVFLLFWSGSYGCYTAHGPFLLTVVLAVGGVMLAIVGTVGMVQNNLRIPGPDGVLVGLLAFGGGNLPLFIIVPTVLIVMRGTY